MELQIINPQVLQEDENWLWFYKNQTVFNSVVIAKQIEVKHKTLLRTIDKILAEEMKAPKGAFKNKMKTSEGAFKNNIYRSTYGKRKYKHYYLTKIWLKMLLNRWTYQKWTEILNQQMVHEEMIANDNKWYLAMNTTPNTFSLETNNVLYQNKLNTIY